MQTLHLDKVEYTEFFLEKSYQWFKDSELKILTLMPNITKEEHWRWFQKIKNKKDYIIYGITNDEVPIGVFGIKHINVDCGEYWGYIGEKAYWGKGIGKWMIEESFQEARVHNLNALYLKVIKSNLRAHKLYEYMGFHTIKEKENILTMYKGNLL